MGERAHSHAAPSATGSGRGWTRRRQRGQATKPSPQGRAQPKPAESAPRSGDKIGSRSITQPGHSSLQPQFLGSSDPTPSASRAAGTTVYGLLGESSMCN
ncbi:hypothetical protein CK820_G0046111 [Pan troglodytes]|uniref:Uncharacterized protein n=1 Tax=Pan troglodytes TaxID=9598 RepID=A0A2J8Q2D5_PANTR|nr:hypothetical protein CK820_G0046111 [Pan troglodytes]